MADRSSFVQEFFLTNGRDETATRLAIQNLFEWIEQSGEKDAIIQRAKSQAAILRSIAAEIRR